ncbi:methyltransferase domain-containing protein [candidate division KSB1 bacterium]|nr:methyltransferase domain-containing protein [candidate division KSB1 bacterium]
MNKNHHEIMWHNYDRYAASRGQMICDLLIGQIPLDGKSILDVGCGKGGTAIALAKAGADVTAIDLDSQRMHLLQEKIDQIHLTLNIQTIPIEKMEQTDAYHAIVLWDVLEHLASPETILKQLYKLLRPQGLLCIATPNRISPFNVICDPHYGLPIVALLPRKSVKKIIANYLGWHKPEKPDFPQLYSLHRLGIMLQSAGFSWRLINRTVVRLALQTPESLWNKPWHLWLFKKLKKINGERWLPRLISDNDNHMNRFFQPTLFILGQKI